MTNMILFDFDGVIIDSVDEVAVSAYNSIKGTMLTSLEELPQGYLRHFINFRHYYKSAEEIYSFAQWCINEEENPAAVLEKAHFRALIEAKEEELPALGKHFFETRNKFLKSAPKKWAELNKPFEPLWSALKEIDPSKILILTNKNQLAVFEIMKHFEMEISTKQIYSADGGATKQENFARIKEDYPSNFYYFIDDALRNLEKLCVVEPDPEKLSLILAKWGYISPEDIESARDQGFLIYEQQDLITLIDAVMN